MVDFQRLKGKDVSVIRFMRRFTVLGLAFLVTFGVWCGGFAGDTPTVLVGGCLDLAPGCTENSTSSGNAGSRNTIFPCVFRSLDLLSQGAPPSVQTHDFFPHGHFVPMVPWSSSEKIALAIHFNALPQNLGQKISPHLFYSVLNL